MKKTLIALSALLVSTAVFAAPATPTTQPKATDLHTSWEVLSRKSIFSRDHAVNYTGPRLRDPDLRTSRNGKGRNNYVPVLRGAMHEDDGFVAFIEDPSSGSYYNFRAGAKLPNGYGTIKSITLDYMTLASASNDAQVKKIMVGQTLNAEEPEVPSESSDSSSSSTSTASTSGDSSSTSPGGSSATGSGATSPPLTGGGDIVAQMRARRAAQIGR